MNQSVFLETRGIIELSGEDCRSFLQDLVSNDIDRLGPAQAIYAALLTPQGKYLFDFFLVEHEDKILLDVDGYRIAQLAKRLEMYRLRADVTIEPLPGTWTVAALLSIPEFLDADRAGACTSVFGGEIFVDPRSPKLGARAILPADQWSAAAVALRLNEKPFKIYQERRLEVGVPDGKQDLEADKTLLLEARFDEWHGVDFTKGCYVGQEVTARSKHRGSVRRRYYPVRFTGPTPASGTPVTLGGRAIGATCSALENRGIAFLRIKDVEDALSENKNLIAGGAALEICEPEFG